MFEFICIILIIIAYWIIFKYHHVALRDYYLNLNGLTDDMFPSYSFD